MNHCYLPAAINIHNSTRDAASQVGVMINKYLHIFLAKRKFPSSLVRCLCLLIINIDFDCFCHCVDIIDWLSVQWHCFNIGAILDGYGLIDAIPTYQVEKALKILWKFELCNPITCCYMFVLNDIGMSELKIINVFCNKSIWWCFWIENFIIVDIDAIVHLSRLGLHWVRITRWRCSMRKMLMWTFYRILFFWISSLSQKLQYQTKFMSF